MDYKEMPNDTFSNSQKIAKEIKDLILQKLDADKAESIMLIDLERKTDLAYYMIIASGNSVRHVNALAENLSMELKKHIQTGIAVEGLNSGQWVLVDTGYVIVHLFQPAVRSQYNIESIWQD